MRSAFAEVMFEELTLNTRSCLLLGDIGINSHKRSFQHYPERVFNLGILEQSMVSVGAGMSAEGFIPTLHTIAPFLVERAFEQIKLDFGYQGLPGNLVTVGASLDYSALGATHHCPGDVSLMSTIPGTRIFVPGHEQEFKDLFRVNSKNGHLNYFRLSELSNSEPVTSFNPGQAKVVRRGSLMTVVAIGPTLDMALGAALGLDATVVYVNCLNPIDIETIIQSVISGRLLIVEPFYEGSIAPLIREIYKFSGIKVEFCGIPRIFHSSYGDVQEHYASFGFNEEGIRTRMVRMCND